MPSGPRADPVTILIHGGSWQKRYGKIFTRGLAGDLRRRGYAVWNIEYRRVGAGGGWPRRSPTSPRRIDPLAALDNRASISSAGDAHRPLAPAATSRCGRPERGESAGGDGRPRVATPDRTHRDGVHGRATDVSLAGVADLADAYRAGAAGVVAI